MRTLECTFFGPFYALGGAYINAKVCTLQSFWAYIFFQKGFSNCFVAIVFDPRIYSQLTSVVLVHVLSESDEYKAFRFQPARISESDEPAGSIMFKNFADLLGGD